MKAILAFFLLTIVWSQIQAQTPVTKVVLDNDNVKVTTFESQPSRDMCGLGKHSHGAHLTVMLTDATVTITQPNGKVVTQKLPAGTTFWSDPGTHTALNSGTNVVKAQIIEYKKQK